MGIVRTEREICARLLSSDGIDALPAVCRDGFLRAIDPSYAKRIVSDHPAKASNGAGASHAPAAREEAGASAMGPARNGTALSFADRLQAFPGLGSKAFRRGVDYARDSAGRLTRLIGIGSKREVPRAADPAPPTVAEPSVDYSLLIHPSRDDVLFMCGLGWDAIDCKMLNRLRQTTGLRIVQIMYDLIPMKAPQFLAFPTDNYLNYFLHMADLCDVVLCISECTRRDFIDFCAAYGRTAPQTRVIRLGANLPGATLDGEIADLRRRLSRRRYALSVGTFEIRKNYRLLIGLWHELVANPEFDLDLVLVGMPGWKVEEDVAALERSPLLGKRIFWLRDLSDAALSWLYEHCHVFLYPSFYEGWGLPIVEALLHKRPAVISNRGAIPEAGMGAATVLDPDDRTAWREEILRWSKRPWQSVNEPLALPTWDKTAADVCATLIDAARYDHSSSPALAVSH